MVERAKTMHGNMRALLHNRRGAPLVYRTIKAHWDAACQAAGLEDVHMHDLRVKSLTDAKRQGHHPQALAGHADPSMTERYIRLRETPEVTGPSFGQRQTR